MTRPLGILPWVMLSATGLLTPTRSYAQARDPVAAEQLFIEGRAAAARGDYATACPKFAESQHLEPATGTLLNLADCEERLGKLASAWQHFREAFYKLLETNDERLQYATRRASQLEKRVPRL